MRSKVKITNPIDNGSSFTSRKRALQYVQTGRAIFLAENQIRFIGDDPRNQAAAERAARGYVTTNRVLTERELRSIPLINPANAYRLARRGSSAKSKGSKP